MTSKELERLKLAREKGFLFSQGPPAERILQESTWRQECRRKGKPIVIASKCYLFKPKELMGQLSVELSGDWWLSRKTWSRLSQELSEIDLYRMGNRFLVRYFPHRDLQSMAELVLDILNRKRPSSEEMFDFPPNLSRGYARCVCAYSMESMLTEGELYYVREIPNMMGHVLALRTGFPPLVGVHLERFEFLKECSDK